MRKIATLLFLLALQVSVYAQSDSLQKPRASHWGFGMELGPCTGKYFLTGEAKQYISEGCIANVSITISYDKFHFIMQLGGISGSIKNELSHGLEWKMGNNFGSSHLQLSFGYELLSTRRLNIIPFASGGMTVFNTRLDTTGSFGAGHSRWSASYSVGSAFDFKMNFPLFKKNREPGVDHGRAYLYFRVLTGIYPNYFRQQLGINGSMYFVNLSVGFYVSGRDGVKSRTRQLSQG